MVITLMALTLTLKSLRDVLALVYIVDLGLVGSLYKSVHIGKCTLHVCNLVIIIHVQCRPVHVLKLIRNFFMYPCTNCKFSSLFDLIWQIKIIKTALLIFL